MSALRASISSWLKPALDQRRSMQCFGGLRDTSRIVIDGESEIRIPLTPAAEEYKVRDCWLRTTAMHTRSGAFY